jgi:peptidoglycan hydrolase-like protein with peptidoglycan-binding domain
VAQAGSEAQAAYNAADLARMRRAVAKALRAARAAPAGAECAVNALNQIADLWNQGAGNLAGANIAAETAAIRRFQRAHKLTRTIF